MLMLTIDQHRDVLARLAALGRRVEDYEFRSAAYPNLMASFLLHQLASANAVLALNRAFGDTWFPAATAYATARTMFEVDVTAHYISQDHEGRAVRYIEFGHVLKKRRMDACAKHRASREPSWAAGMAMEWEHRWAPVEVAVNSEYSRVRAMFETTGSNGKVKAFTNWSGKTIRELAAAVQHAESYEMFYSDLSSFAHADIRLANRYLKVPAGGPVLSSRADEYDVGAALRYAATFLTCFLGLFGRESKLWTQEEIDRCWTDIGV